MAVNRYNRGQNNRRPNDNNGPTLEVSFKAKASNPAQPAPAPINLKTLELTEYLPDGRLMFNPRTSEIWTLTGSQQEYKTASIVMMPIF